MGGEKFTFSKGKKPSTWTRSTDIKSASWSINTAQNTNSFVTGLGISAPTWNQTIDDTSEDWGKPWDWVFLTTTWENLNTETGNWEDWN